VSITLTTRRLFCDNPGCARVTFAEQVDGLTVRYGRRTPQLTGLSGAIAVARLPAVSHITKTSKSAGRANNRG
jgi:hypothetical protein